MDERRLPARLLLLWPLSKVTAHMAILLEFSSFRFDIGASSVSSPYFSAAWPSSDIWGEHQIAGVFFFSFLGPFYRNYPHILHPSWQLDIQNYSSHIWACLLEISFSPTKLRRKVCCGNVIDFSKRRRKKKKQQCAKTPTVQIYFRGLAHISLGRERFIWQCVCFRVSMLYWKCSIYKSMLNIKHLEWCLMIYCRAWRWIKTWYYFIFLQDEALCLH